MRESFRVVVIVFLLVALSASYASSWGFWAHRKINRQAVFSLPPELVGFYKSHIDYITEHAVDADKRRYINKAEGPYHYISIDHYGLHPFDSIPMDWNDAVAKYSKDTLNAYGTVPWQIIKMENNLTAAFKEKDADKILYYSANIGHYIADAHVPLHTCLNYNGQFTNQQGIHAFWESRIPELLGETFDFYIGRAHYIEKPRAASWQIVKESFAAVDSVLNFEKLLNNQFQSDKKHAYESRGAATPRVYSKEYSKAYSDMLDGMVERRMRAAMMMISSFWYTAWVNAGRPDLKAIERKEISEETKKELAEQDSLFKQCGGTEKDSCIIH